MDFTSTATPKNMSIKAYRKAKVKMLSRDFCLKLTESEIKHLNDLKTEISVDNYCRDLIANHLERSMWK